MSKGFILAVLLAVGSSACGGKGSEPPASSAISAPTTSAVAVTTAAPTTAAAPATTAAEPWLVVALGDSTPAGSGVGSALAYPVIYGDLLAADLDIDVTVDNYATGGTRSVADWVDLVRADEAIGASLGDAEIVMMWLGWHDILPLVYVRTAASWPDPMRQQLVDQNVEMAAGWEDLLAAVRAAVPPGAVILVADTGIPGALIEKFGGELFWPELKSLIFLDWRDGLVRAAAEHGAVVVPTWMTLAGPDGESDLYPEFASEDGLHFNEAGQRFLAGLHRRHDGLGGG